MPALNVSGTPAKFTVEGIAFNLAADVDIEDVFVEWENSAIPTSGNPMRKMVKRTADQNGLIVMTNADERKSLKFFAESTSSLQLAVTNRAGDTTRCLGILEIPNNQTAENRTTLNAIPMGPRSVSIGG